MSNIYLKVTIEKNGRSQSFDFLSSTNLFQLKNQWSGSKTMCGFSTLNVEIFACRKFRDFENQFFFLVFIFAIFSYEIISRFLFSRNKEFNTNQFKSLRTN